MVDLGKPTLAEARQWRDQIAATWGGAGASFESALDEEESLYFQSYAASHPTQRAIRTGSAPSDADGAIDSLAPNQIQVHCRPARATKDHRALADKRTRVAQGLLHAWRVPRDVVRLAASDAVIRRVGVLRVLWDATRWPAHPSNWQSLSAREQDAWELRHRNRCPIIAEVRNPRYVRWRDAQDGSLMAVVEHYPMSSADAWVTFAAAYPRAKAILSAYKDTPHITVWVDDLWIGNYRCLLIEDQPVFSDGRSGAYQGIMESPYSEIPYVVSPYRELNFEAPSERYRGMLSNAGDVYRNEGEVLGMLTQMVRWNAWRTWKGWFRGEKEQLEIIPGQMLWVAKHQNEYIEPMTGETFPPDIVQPIQLYDGYIQRNSVAGGGPTTGEGSRSAQQVWAQMSLRQLKLEHAKSNLQTAVSQMLRLATIIGSEFLGDDVLTLPLPGRDAKTGAERGEVAIRAADLRDYPDCYEVSFGARPDPALIELNKALMTFAQGNYISLQTALEMGGMVPLAKDEIDAMRLQAIERLPFEQELAALLQAEEYFGRNTPEYEFLASKLAEQHAKEAAGGGAMPGSPGTPSPGGGGSPPGGLQRSGEPMGGPRRNGKMGGGGGRKGGGGSTRGRAPGVNTGGAGGVSR